MCFGDRSLFGVPDEITDMKRSLEMVKIHILEGYIRTPKWFGSFRISFGVPGVTGTRPPRQVIGPHGPSGGREEAGQGVPPLAQTELD